MACGNQRTVGSPASLAGTSLHTGQPVTLTLKPAPADFGIKFRRVDIPDQPFISADVEKVQTVERATSLAEGSVKVHTVEHILSALTGMGIDNAVIEMDANEPPIGDGSDFCLEETKQFVRNIAVGATMPSINTKLLGEVEIALPDLNNQKRIAAVLSSLDDKIENNQKLNDNLQQQAMALYAEMFLNSSDNNVTSGTLSDIAAITMGQSPSGSSYNEDGVGEVFYQGRAEFGFRFPKRRLFTTEPKRMAETGDVLLSVRAPVGDLNVAYERCCIGRGLGAIHSKTGHSSFVLYTMFALRSQLDVFNGEGTVFGSINRDALNAIPIDIPPVTEIDQFEAVAHPIDELIRANYEENCRLEAIRDSLLPKLMSGEIDVSAVNL